VTIENQTQLAQLLDKIASLYPAGIPTATIVAPVNEPLKQEPSATVRARLIVVGDSSTHSAEELALLDAIAIKGLKLSEDDYTKEFVAVPSDAFASGRTDASAVIIFGAAEAPQNTHGQVILTSSLSELVVDPALKKALWRSLQTLS
jgi:hypothetical protein